MMAAEPSQILERRRSPVGERDPPVVDLEAAADIASGDHADSDPARSVRSSTAQGSERPRWQTVVTSTPLVMTRSVMASPINDRAVSIGTGPTPGISQMSPSPTEPRRRASRSTRRRTVAVGARPRRRIGRLIRPGHRVAAGTSVPTRLVSCPTGASRDLLRSVHLRPRPAEQIRCVMAILHRARASVVLPGDQRHQRIGGIGLWGSCRPAARAWRNMAVGLLVNEASSLAPASGVR